MPLGKQITKVSLAFLTSATASTPTTSVAFSVNNFTIEPTHETLGDNPMNVKSENGTILPYTLRSRVKFSFNFDKSIESDKMRSLFNLFIDYSVIDRRMRLYYNLIGSAQDTNDFIDVQLNEAMIKKVEYSNTVGKLMPSIKLVSRSLATSLPSAFQFVDITP
jgi:hypothetical protein